jgi:hypothetical protein
VGERAVLYALGKRNISWYYEDSNPRSAQPLANYYIDYVSFVQSGSLQAFLVVQVRSWSFCDTAQRHWVFGCRRFGPDIDFVFRGGEVKVSLEDWGKPRGKIRIRSRKWKYYVKIYIYIYIYIYTHTHNIVLQRFKSSGVGSLRMCRQRTGSKI